MTMELPPLLEALALRRHLGEAMERAQTLEFRNQELEAFIYIITHDMKTPLVNLQGLVDLVEQPGIAVGHEGSLERRERHGPTQPDDAGLIQIRCPARAAGRRRCGSTSRSAPRRCLASERRRS